MFAYYKVETREACKCGVKTKGRLHAMGSNPEPICSKCFRDLNRSLRCSDHDEYEQ